MYERSAASVRPSCAWRRLVTRAGQSPTRRSRRSCETGARIIRTEAELVLKSRWVDPAVLLASGFEFDYPTLESALAEIADSSPRGLLPVALG